MTMRDNVNNTHLMRGSETDLPKIPQDLMEALDKRFPERCPDPKASEREVWIEVGKRELIRFLKTHYERQNKNVLRQ